MVIRRSLAVLSAICLIVILQVSGSGSTSMAFARNLAAPTPTPTAVIGSSIQSSGGIIGKGAPNPSFLKAKEAMAAQYARARAGTIPMAQYSADQRGFEAAWYGPSPAGPRARSAIIGKALASPAFACCYSHDLAVNQTAQQSNTYCGPGATYSVLAYLGYSTSHDGESLSQSCVGGTCGAGAPNSQKYLETNYWGNTPWYVSANDHPVPGTLNYWRTGYYSGYYVGVFPSSESSYESDLTYDIDNYWPTMNDVHEPANGTHLVGHPPTLEIFHWITDFGYTNYGAGTDYVDPAANSTLGWTQVPATNYNYASSDMYYLMSNNGQTFGIVW